MTKWNITIQSQRIEIFAFYWQAFRIPSISAINATLHSQHCASEIINLCIVLNSSGLAPCSIDFISSRMLSFSCLIKSIPKILVLILPKELLEPNGKLSTTLPEGATLWFQYSTHRWLGSWASMAWKFQNVIEHQK